MYKKVGEIFRYAATFSDYRARGQTFLLLLKKDVRSATRESCKENRIVSPCHSEEYGLLRSPVTHKLTDNRYRNTIRDGDKRDGLSKGFEADTSHSTLGRKDCHQPEQK